MNKPQHRLGHGALLSLAHLFSIACILAILLFVIFHGSLASMQVPG